MPRFNLFRLLRENLPHGSGIDADWLFDIDTRGHINCYNSFHVMDEYGSYRGWAPFHARLAWNGAGELELDKVMFHGQDAQKLNQRYDLRMYLEDTIALALSELPVYYL